MGTASAISRGFRNDLSTWCVLRIDAVWMRDFGYDVSDYRAIHPLFGSLDVFDALLESAHFGPHGHPGFRAQPHLRSTSLVPGESLLEAPSKAGLVCLARREA